MASNLKKRLAKKAKKGFRGYPVGTLAFYGPDDRLASKVVASVVAGEGQESAEMRTWFSDDRDLRNDTTVFEKVVGLFDQHGVHSIAMLDRIMGCPHEEGIDYQGPTCPQCPFWSNRERWSGEIIH